MRSARHTIVLPPGHEAAAVARTFVADHGWRLPPEVLADAQLCVSELVSNAVLHGRPDITLEVSADPPGIGLAVTDHGPEFPVHLNDQPDPTDTRGRGLMIVAALADSWGVRHEDVGGDHPYKTIWFQLSP